MGPEHGIIELSQKIVEIVAVRLDRLERSTDSSDKVQLVSATVGYYIVRVHLAWLQGRSDIADHLFSKIPAVATSYDQRRVLELCYKIGNFALVESHYDNAAKWLERALSAWELYNGNMAQDVGNDALPILHASIRANLHLESSLAKERLAKALNLVEKKYRHAFAVKALQLEILSREGHSDGNEYLQSKALFFLQKVRDHQTSFYVQGLQQILVAKLANSDQQEWTERIFILLVWTLTNSRLHTQNNSSILCDTMKRMAKCGRGLLSEDATNACLIVTTLCAMESNFLEGKYIASLFIAAGCLVSAQLGKTGKVKEDDGLLAQVIRVLEAAHKSGQNTVFSAIELEWLSQRSYSIAVQARLCDSRLVVQLLDLSIQFTDLQRKATTCEKQSNLWQHYLHCDIIKAFRAIAEARKETEPSLKACLALFPLYQHYRTYIQNRPQPENTADQNNEWLQKYRRILSIDLECALFFNQWDYVSSIIEESKSIIDGELGSIFLDYVLRCGASVTYIVKVVEKIVLVLRTTTSPYLEAATARAFLPRYIHTFFQLSLDASEYCLAESALDLALASACDLCGTTLRYPSDEIQWMATVAFNRAVDLYLLSESGECQRWAEKATKLADLGEEDCAMLGKLLREKLQKLS
ncbi:hypothetical protein ANOM_006848 [Aspergillus nomiae NRRL 13137]|uniref:Meiosis protein SPO22/ZIP4 like protein n=1 Tax=Aspergillus nomiae NRRL (strain ATCC 15546 / NRRL 13137 / CBS 260.88 / M93) TaxID=1509407 RepID=A0A0L1IXU1_ASPN3|nr:uncharacterized protein ANOM_006848 [Aspergillus nomiae NRRL 13137]KNG84376.1 hypothetical protein ANOM_006848 [Aspergillus nomiae NRRL 13137]